MIFSDWTFKKSSNTQVHGIKKTRKTKKKFTLEIDFFLLDAKRSKSLSKLTIFHVKPFEENLVIIFQLFPSFLREMVNMTTKCLLFGEVLTVSCINFHGISCDILSASHHQLQIWQSEPMKWDRNIRAQSDENIIVESLSTT